MTWLLSWLFPMVFMLRRARRLGAISFTEVAGVGWQCSIRPPHGDGWKNRGLNSWSGQGSSLGRALAAAVDHADVVGRPTREGATFAPKLGGAEFDE